MPEGAELDAALANLASYSMSMGYEEDGRYHGLQNLGRSDFALISDVPDPTSVSFRSHNHPGGQNILFEGGNVRYVTVPVSTVGNDHYYLNAAGRIGPGLNRYDSVIPPAGRIPIVYASKQVGELPPLSHYLSSSERRSGERKSFPRCGRLHRAR